MAHMNREDLLQRLESVSPGLASNPTIAQSHCFAFVDERIITFSGEVSCYAAAPPDCEISGAIPAAPLLAILRKFNGDDIDVTCDDERVHIKSLGGEKAGIRLEQEVQLPYEAVEIPKTWHELNTEFCDAIGIVETCANKSDKRFQCQCIHIDPEYVEATDNTQACRYPLSTGVRRSVMVKKEAIRHIAQLGMVEFAETRGWLHFRNAAGLTVACRRHTNEWFDISEYFEMEGSPFALPGGLEEELEKAAIFTVDQSEESAMVRIDLRPGKMRLRGEGPIGYFQKPRKVDWRGGKHSFRISPVMLAEIAKKHTRCIIGEDRLKVDGGKFTYIACLLVKSDEQISVE